MNAGQNLPPAIPGDQEEGPGEPSPSPGDVPAVSRAEAVMRALARAYPSRIGPAEYRNGDWAAPIQDTWFYYAGGRLLPEEMRDREEEYDPQPFYTYTAELAPWREPGAEESERFSATSRRRRVNPPKRPQFFYDALWRAHNREEAYERVKTIRFLGRNVLVHYTILEDLVVVEEKIREAAKTDPRIQQWINGIATLTGWNWRNIAETESRSFHAYGAAIDLLPASPQGLETYWLWTAEKTPQWWAVPYERRLHPPQEVIRAFESQGFIWGGKWLFYDTMHFEYRPEILIFNGLFPE